jgi:hypothetical protein
MARGARHFDAMAAQSPIVARFAAAASCSASSWWRKATRHLPRKGRFGLTFDHLALKTAS